MKRAVGVSGLVLGMMLLSASSVSATVSGENGRIAFRTHLNHAHTWGAIFTINPNGTGLRQITHTPHGIMDTEPDWSPDGRWLVYSRYRQDHRSAIFKIRANGTESQRLLDCPSEGEGCETQYLPSWSPNGRRIAFTAERDPVVNSELFVMRADGTDVEQVTSAARRFDSFGPQWAPGGGRLVFERFDEVRQLSAVFTVRLNGTDERRLTPWGMDAGEPTDWSPDGHWIVLLNHSWSFTPSTVWLVHPNGTGLHEITSKRHGKITWLSSSFSPDGTLIAVSRKRWTGDNVDVVVIRLDGSLVRNVTASPTWESFADWGARAVPSTRSA
jgi:Tol biopolymer transport system component